MAATFFEVKLFDGNPAADVGATPRTGCAHLHPGDQIGDLCVAEFSFRRHPHLVISVANRTNQPTLFRRVPDDRRPPIAPPDDVCHLIQPQPRPLLVRTMTRITMFREERPYPFFVELNTR